MKVLVVDDDVDFRALVEVLLHRSYPRAAITGYDPAREGMPPGDFPWADYDVVLLDHELHAEYTGLDWLRRYSGLPGFPAVIFTTGHGDENLAARAMKFGADEYLSKRELSAGRLGELVGSVIAERSAPAAAPAPAALALPGHDEEAARRIAPGYVLRRLLGCGGSADVYLAERARDGLTVVVKLLREGMAHDALAIARLEREARALGAIDSPHVVRVYGHGVHAGRAFLAMEYLGHGDLRARIAEGLAEAEALAHARAIAAGLAVVHAHGIVHRDLKPGNVMFRYDESLALTDFGIARDLDAGHDMTTTGSVVGTPSYMSPEQCEGLPADARSDLYALGVMLFEMLTGRRPYNAESASMLFLQQAEAPIPELPPELARHQRLIERLMAKAPAERYPDAASLLADLGTG